VFLARKLDPRVEWATAAPSPAGTTRFDGHRGHRSVFDKSLQRPSRPFPSARVFINISAVRSIFPPSSIFVLKHLYIYMCVYKEGGGGNFQNGARRPFSFFNHFLKK